MSVGSVVILLFHLRFCNLFYLYFFLIRLARVLSVLLIFFMSVPLVSLVFSIVFLLSISLIYPLIFTIYFPLIALGLVLFLLYLVS